MHPDSLCRVLICLALLLPIACDTGRAPSLPGDGGPRRDATPLDAPSDHDAGTDVIEDAAVDGDAAVATGACDVDLFSLGTDAPPRAREVGLAAGPTGAAFVWSAGVGALDDIHFAELSTDASVITSVALTGGGSVSRDPVIAAVEGGWAIAWYSNAHVDFDVYSAIWREGSTGEHLRLTTRTGRDDSPALLSTVDGALAAWVEERSITSRVAVTRALGSDGSPSGEARDASLPAFSISRPLLTARAGGYALTWVDSSTAAPMVLLQPLDPSGSLIGTPTPLNTEENADGTVDLAMRASGGAAVFGVLVETRSEVRARMLDADGQPTGAERVITPAPVSGRDASIDFFRGGYAVAYRAPNGSTGRLEIAMVSATLDVVTTIVVTDDLALTGGRITVRTTHEGDLVLAWADVDERTTSLRAARVRCE